MAGRACTSSLHLILQELKMEANNQVQVEMILFTLMSLAPFAKFTLTKKRNSTILKMWYSLRSRCTLCLTKAATMVHSFTWC
jgi:hypothetical protein